MIQIISPLSVITAGPLRSFRLLVSKRAVIREISLSPTSSKLKTTSVYPFAVETEILTLDRINLVWEHLDFKHTSYCCSYSKAFKCFIVKREEIFNEPFRE